MGSLRARLPRRLGRWSVLLAVLAVTYFGPALFPPAGRALSRAFRSRTYDFPRVLIDATVNQDGSMSVVERRTYRFRGRYTFAVREIEHATGDDVSGFSVGEGGRRFRVVDRAEGDPPPPPGVVGIDDDLFRLRATWGLDTGGGGERTFVIRYRARCAVDTFADGAHLAWQFIPGGFDRPTAFARITIHVPGHGGERSRPPTPCDTEPGPVPATSVEGPLRPGEVRAWGHGPLQGTVRIADPQTVVLEVRDLRPNRFVEAGVLFPADAVPLDGVSAMGYGPDRAAGQVSSAAGVLAQERGLADRANAARRRARLFDALWRWARVAYPVALLGLLAAAMLRERDPTVPRLLQEPPEDLHPVDLAVLWGSYGHTPTAANAYRAQILSLARRRVIDLVPVGSPTAPSDLAATLRDLPSDPVDQEFTEYLFADRGVGPVRLSTLRPVGARGKELRQWSGDVVRRLRRQLGRRSGRWEARAMLLALLGFVVLGAVAAVVLHRPGFWWSIVGGALLWGLARYILPPRYDAGTRRRLARWRAFRRFLLEFSSLPEAPALAVTIWERYLIDAAALGVAARVVEQVRAVAPGAGLASPWAGGPAGAAGLAAAATMAAVAGSGLSLVSPGSSTGGSGSGSSWSGSSSGSFSSSVGSGGGFSGGGGGAGGGGGGGAG
jgi:Predicted membrane protein (DUF2207)